MRNRLKYIVRESINNHILREYTRDFLKKVYDSIADEERREQFRQNVRDRNQKLYPKKGIQVLGHYKDSYYTRKDKVSCGLQSLSKAVKKGNIRAINFAAAMLSEIMAPDALLIPVPQTSGNAEYTLELAKAIKDFRPDCEILDILKSNKRESLYYLKKKNPKLTDVDLGFFTNEADFQEVLNTHPNVYLLDNVADTGTTYTQAKRKVEEYLGVTPVMLAISATPRTSKMAKVVVWFENFLDGF